MTLLEAIDARHSVRAYKDQAVPPQIRAELDAFAAELNAESGLSIQVVYDDPAGFDTRKPGYGSFSGVSSYIVLAGKPCPDFDFLCGWYGEAMVLKAQQLGLNTCWTALTYNKKRVKQLVEEGQQLCMAISLGYGVTQGVPHKSKPVCDVVDGELSGLPEWFLAGVEAALKAPTAMNQQKFAFSYRGEKGSPAEEGRPFIRVKGLSILTKVDLGIAAYHFWAATGIKPIRE